VVFSSFNENHALRAVVAALQDCLDRASADMLLGDSSYQRRC